MQCNNKGSSDTSRGHQFPAAFMICAAGLDKHGLASDRPLAYTHLDIAGRYEILWTASRAVGPIFCLGRPDALVSFTLTA